MLTPHSPSQNLHAPRRVHDTRPEDLADVHIIVVPSTKQPADRPAARAKASGRTASINARPPS